MAEDKIRFYAWYAGRQLADLYQQGRQLFKYMRSSRPKLFRTLWLSSAALNFVAAGSVGMMILSRPAVREFNENILHKQELAVTFYDRNDQIIGRRGIRLDDSIQLEDYPKYFIDAVLATEDRRFYSHWGIDPVGIARALVNNNAGGHTQGGSSITQQLAKNLFLSNERTFQRKIKEAFLAMALEVNLTKEEILKLYLDRAYMGGGSYGAAEAARHYFNKSAKDLSVSEAAILAGLFKAPSRFSPEANPERSRQRWRTVLDNLRTTRSITDEQFEEALLYPPEANIFRDNTAANYYLDWAWDEIKRMEAEGLLGTSKVLKVQTALDLKVQRRSEEVITKQLEEAEDRFDVEQAAVVIMQTDGGVLSMIGGNDYRDSAFNRATKALRQPGSSFKTYVYATAVDEGILDKDTIVTDRPTCIGRWCPHNYNRGFAGSMPAWQAVAQSINTIPVQLSIQLGKEESSVKAGRAKIQQMARRMGVKSELYDAQCMPIGCVEMTVMDQAVGYATLASGGLRTEPYAAVTIRDSQNNIIWQRKPERVKVLSDRVVSNMNFMLNRVVEAGTARSAQILGQQIAGKTGTTNAYRDAWFVGYTGAMVGAVWMGNDDNTSSRSMTGGSLPARTWKAIMEEAVKTQPTKSLPLVAQTTQKPQERKVREPVPVAPRQMEPPAEPEKTFIDRLFNR